MKITTIILDYINSLRSSKLITDSLLINYKYNASICVIAKNEEPYFEEWLDYHFKIGFEHIYIIDNNSNNRLDTFLSSYLNRKLITIINYREVKPSCQDSAYCYCMLNFGSETRWMAFIDVDEFFVLKRHENISEFLKKYIKYPSIIVSWVMFGANGQLCKSSGKVMDRFPTPAKEGTRVNEMNMCFKSIVQTICYTSTHDCSIRSAHRWTYPAFNEKGKRVFGETSKQSVSYIALNHYYTKSYEEFLSRISSGDVAGFVKTKENFFAVNPLSMRTEIENYTLKIQS
jgi:hypothetical protein